MMTLPARAEKQAQALGMPRIKANLVAYNAALSACEVAGEWQQGLHLLEVSDFRVGERASQKMLNKKRHAAASNCLDLDGLVFGFPG